MKVLKELWAIIAKTVERWSRNDGNMLAASMAYYAAFSFFPLVSVLLSVLGFALRFSTSVQGRREQFLEFVSRTTSPSLADQVSQFVDVVQERAFTSGVFGIGVLLLGAIGVFSQLEAAFGRLWHAVTPAERGVRAAIRNALWNRLKAFLALMGLGLVMLVALLVQLLLTAVETWAEKEHLHWTLVLWPSLQIGVAVTINALALSLIFKTIPRVTVMWRHALVGGVAVAVIWQIGAALLSQFFIGGHYSAYGIVGSFIVIMLWVYCASILLLLGAQLVQVLGHPEENSVALATRPMERPQENQGRNGIQLGTQPKEKVRDEESGG
ncbi:MAG: YihY/virulence factor BrkB family protein [Planctomycetota bacterium]|nr:MAG: YihY/virulence factor BrkB family protein [Planctomycetota bacterium]